MGGYKLFLDDIRIPTTIYPNTKDSDWVICRNLTEFKDAIETKGVPDYISFDNDLGESMEEGKDAVKWLVYDKEADIRNMNYKVHSANSSGVREYILDLLENWKKHLNENPPESLNEYLDASYAKEVADKLANKIKLKKPVLIDCGSGGCAFKLNEKIILKITPDKSEAAESNKIVGKKNKHLANIYKVYHLKKENGDAYAILCERLDLNNKIDDADYILREYLQSIEGPNLSTFFDDYANYRQGMGYDDYYEEVKSMVGECKKKIAVWYFTQMLELIDELKKNGIKSFDFGPVNLGLKKDGSIGYFDLGYGDANGNTGEIIHLNEAKEKTRSIIFEYLQQAEKTYFKPGVLSNEDKEQILKITNGDNFTKTISDLYYSMAKSKKDSETRIPDYELEVLKGAYEEIKNYNKNVFPIKDYNPFEIKNAFEFIRGLNNRKEIIEKMKLLPSIAIRNLKNDIRVPRNSKELERYKSDLKNFILHIASLGNRDEKMRDAILRKMFKSNTTMADLSNFVEEKQNLLGGAVFTKKKVKDICDEYMSESDIIYDKGNIMVVEIYGPRGIKNIGCNSVWCFTYGKDNWQQWNKYSTNGLCYAIINFSEPSDSLDFMHVLIQPVDWDDIGHDENDEDIHTSELYSMDNEPVYGAGRYLIDWVGGEEEAKKIFSFGETYISPKEVKQNVQQVFDEYYSGVESPFPHFKEFYEKYLEHFPLTDDSKDYAYRIRKIAEDAFKKIITNPDQTSLFEANLRKAIRNILLKDSF